MFKYPPLLTGLKSWYRSWFRKSPQRRPARQRTRLAVEGLEERQLLAADTLPVLMVLANQDFWYQDYSEPRQALMAAGHEVEVAAATSNVCVPHVNSGQGLDGGLVAPDLTLAAVNAADYSAVIFVGGWGASQYQYAFEGTYTNAAYNGTDEVRGAVNRVINEFVTQDKFVAALCTGVSVLAWARVNGHSLLEGRSVAGYAGWMPDWLDGNGNYHGGTLTTWHVQTNGSNLFPSGSLGDPASWVDDVWVDGKIITAEDYRSGYLLGQVLAEQLAAPPVNEPLPQPTPETPGAQTPAPPQRVLLVIANQDFFYQEYSEPRQELEAAGFVVEVAAALRDLCYPHTGSGEGADGGVVAADWALAEVDSTRYEAIVFVGGWGASQYQYAYTGTYDNNYYNGNAELRDTVNQLINEFSDQGKYIAGICHGVSVLAWARVAGDSLLEGRTVAGFARGAPAGTYDGVHFNNFEQGNAWHIEVNGGLTLPSGSVGDPSTTADDVWVDGHIITAENNESARRLGEVLVEELTRTGS